MPETAVARELEVPLHALGAEIEPAVAQAQRLVHVLVVELERERRRARDDLELVDLELDLARVHLRVHRLGRARDDLARRPEDELVADLLRQLGRGRRALGVHHELHDTRPVAEVDEDEPAVIAAAGGPAGERQRLADVRRARLAAHEVAPLAHREKSADDLGVRDRLVRRVGAAQHCRLRPDDHRRLRARRGPPASAAP